MTEQDAIEAIKTINAATGYAYYPTEVTNEVTVKPQGVQVSIVKGAVTCSINADGRCLERIQEAITAKIPDVLFTSIDIEIKPKRKRKVKDDGDSTTT